MLLVILVILAHSGAIRAAEAIPLGSGPHLFLDETLIEDSTNVTPRVIPPRRDPQIPNPLVTGKEDGCFQPYMTVLREASTGRFRLWYGVHTADFNTSRSHLGYLESADGVHWLRPHRVLPDPAPIQFGVSILDDGPQCPNPAQRFKLGWYFGNGLRVAASPDGLDWKPLSSGVVLEHNHDINGLFWDPIRRRYVATVSCYVTGPSWTGQRRVTQQSVSTNLLEWRQPWFVLTPDDRRDPGETQFYAMDGFLARGSLIVGMVKVLRDDLKADTPPDPPDAQGIGYTALAWTHDGDHWIRDPTPFFEPAPERGAWDHAHAWIDEQVPVGDDVHLYYGGYRRGHKVNRFEERQIGLVRIRRDRYVAREAGTVEGTLTTPLLLVRASALTLNVRVPPGGHVRVQVLDPAGRPIPGFSKTDHDPVRGDTLAAPVRWKRPISALAGKPVRFEFSLEQAQLFAFELHPSLP
ncbi:MAG TPA: hypothetical protein PKM73_18460 [Verrucomicrobiota bacterium]|nr:hypothetical protein [Verrucomicrobiota bacterium]HNU52230.1 hypothetical protein [Verrucomicrobiota bacterium]